MNQNHKKTDHGPEACTVNMPAAARRNTNFRTAFWTGCQLQLTFMQIPVRGEIGLECHPDTEQFVRVEQGQALVCMGSCKEKLDFQCRLGPGDAVFIPQGCWHNICNTGRCPLKLSSIYAPPHHPRGTVHPTKEDAEDC